MTSSPSTYAVKQPSTELGKRDRQLLNIFRIVTQTYADYKAVAGTSANSGAFGRSSNDSTGNGGGIITMGPSDFICDVEVTARAALTAPELAFFQGVVIDDDVSFIERITNAVGSGRYKSIKQRVSLKLGAAFQTRGVFPVSEYFRPIDMR